MPRSSPTWTTDRQSLDATMERASGALTAMDYAGCEALCMEALAGARALGDWGYYARVLLPLQEARRQRRMIAADGVIRLGSTSLKGEPIDWLGGLEGIGAGCIALTHSHTAAEARILAEAAYDRRAAVEVLFVDGEAGAARWRLRAFAGPKVECEVAAPPSAWIDRQLEGSGESGGAADWFIDATEALGDASLAQVQAPLGTVERVRALEDRLAVVRDHELLHQALGQAARALAMGAGDGGDGDKAGRA